PAADALRLRHGEPPVRAPDEPDRAGRSRGRRSGSADRARHRLRGARLSGTLPGSAFALGDVLAPWPADQALLPWSPARIRPDRFLLRLPGRLLRRGRAV